MLRFIGFNDGTYEQKEIRFLFLYILRTRAQVTDESMHFENFEQK